MLKNTGLFYGYIIVLVSFFIMFIILGLQSTFGIFFKPIISDIGWTRAVTSGAFSLSLLVSGAISIAMGSLNDRFGPRIVLTLCGFLCGTGHILMSLVDTIWEIYLYYGILIGVGSGVFAPVLSTVARWFIGKRNMMTGIVFAGTGIGILILPPIINHLISIYEWRNSFIILGVAVFVIVIGAEQLMKREPVN
jgi:MFS family permease